MENKNEIIQFALNYLLCNSDDDNVQDKLQELGMAEQQLREIERSIQPNKQIYIIHHSHDNGDSIYLVKSNSEPTIEESVEFLGIEFEPELEEFIDIMAYNEDEIDDFDELREQFLAT